MRSDIIYAQRCQICHSNWVRLAPNLKNLCLFKISFSTFGSPSQNVLKLILKRHRFVPFGSYLTQFGCKICHECSLPWLCPACRQKVMDLYFVLDSSTSIYRPDYERVLDFVKDVVSRLHVSPQYTRVGMVTFSNNYNVSCSMSAMIRPGMSSFSPRLI